MRETTISRGGPASRRLLLGAVAAAPFLAPLGGSGRAQAAPVRTRARIVIAGAGAAGLACANRLAARLEGAEIILLDRRRQHLYQPGFTLVAAGLKPAGYVIGRTADYVPAGVSLREEAAAAFDPVARTVTTDAGNRLPYDFLILATGLALDYAAIEGMDTARIGRDGLGSVYAGPEQAEATYRAMAAFAEKGGTAVFGRPSTEMKCAGAPLKYAFIVDDILRKAGTRNRSSLIYHAHNKVLFSVPIVSERVRMLYQDRGIAVNYENELAAIDIGRRVASFRTPQGLREQPYDFINVVPPMRAPQAVRDSGLGWRTGPFRADGWAEVDRHTLRHAVFPEIFAVGDIAGVPKGKTAASVKWQVPVAVDHLVAGIAGRESTERYDGYTSCPLITRIGRAMLVEFDYNDNLVPSFPGIIAPLEELWITWMMKEVALKPTYLAMLRGQA